MSVYTTTLASDNILLIQESADFGEIIITALILILIAVIVLDFVHRLAYRE